MKNDLNNYDDSNSSSENLKAACLVIDEFDKFNNKLSKKTCYAAENKTENENKTVY